MRILVVPKRTKHTPDHAHVGEPDLFSPRDAEVEISCVFTWDKLYAHALAASWRDYGCSVRLGGPAFDDPGGEFEPGRYVKSGIVHTSRGCWKRCPWCYVPVREGRIRRLKIQAGNIVQDNNLLACGQHHVELVFQMLRSQRGICFSGGLDADLFKPWVYEGLSSLRIKEIWTAMDSPNATHALSVIRKLRKMGVSQRKIRCYTMIGYNGESLADAEARCIEVFKAGAYPFAQIYDRKPDITKEWRKLAKTFMRPGLTKVYLKKKRKR